MCHKLWKHVNPSTIDIKVGSSSTSDSLVIGNSRAKGNEAPDIGKARKARRLQAPLLSHLELTTRVQSSLKYPKKLSALEF
jgi:hypothetical protein